MKAVWLALAILSISFIVGAECSDVGESCTMTLDCCSGYCYKGKCVLPTTINDSATVPLGGQCNFTRQCISGYCINNKCTFLQITCVGEKGVCNFSSDCCGDLICHQNVCEKAEVLPQQNWEAPQECRNMFQECTSFGCIAICNGLWLLLLLFSLSAGYVYYVRSERQFSDRFVAIVAVLVPLAFGITMYTTLGDIAALVEVAYFLGRTGERKIKMETASIAPKKPTTSARSRETIDE